MNRKEIKRYFKTSNLSEAEGLLVTTVGKLCNKIDYTRSYSCFAKDVDKSKIFFVEHDVRLAIDAGTWKEDLITLRELNYKNAKSVVVNPHYFGIVNNRPKNNITNFITIGAIKDNKCDNELIINAVKSLIEQGNTNFKITVIGKGRLKHIPEEIRRFFEIKGRLPFNKLYEEIEKSDFLITAYDKNNPKHIRYNTTGSSGNFQLVYGFNKPCVIIREFAAINGFNDSNAVLYNESSDFANALKRAVYMSDNEYQKLKKSLGEYSNYLYEKSLQNLKDLIISRNIRNE